MIKKFNNFTNESNDVYKINNEEEIYNEIINEDLDEDLDEDEVEPEYIPTSEELKLPFYKVFR